LLRSLLLAALALLPVQAHSMSGSEPEFEPFFNERRESVPDPTPPPPILSVFEEGILSICGDWGAPVRREGFLALIRKPSEEMDVLRAVMPRLSDSDLTEIWFKRDGFRHVFCGEPEGDKLGGLHWVGRYLQAQEKGWAGIMEPGACRASEITPPVYTIGTHYRRGDGGIGAKCPGGYAYSEAAVDILIETTEAVRAARKWAGQGRQVCIGEAHHPDGSFPLVVVVDAGALVTAYPDVSPPVDAPKCQR
jgi:hypothetical protein